MPSIIEEAFLVKLRNLISGLILRYSYFNKYTMKAVINVWMEQKSMLKLLFTLIVFVSVQCNVYHSNCYQMVHIKNKDYLDKFDPKDKIIWANIDHYLIPQQVTTMSWDDLNDWIIPKKYKAKKNNLFGLIIFKYWMKCWAAHYNRWNVLTICMHYWFFFRKVLFLRNLLHTSSIIYFQWVALFDK